MKQHLVTVENSDAKAFANEVNTLLAEGYEVKSTHIKGEEVGIYDEFSTYQAILVKDVIREVPPPDKRVKNIPEFKK